jgi:predicted restriction endonuclease
MKNNSQNSRPENLDERVFFGEELSRSRSINERDLLYLHLDKKSAKKFKWSLKFDIWASGKTNESVVFTEDEFREIIALFESKPFDWNHRNHPSDYPSFICYRYAEIDDTIEVANKVADFSYRLHNDPDRRLLISQIYEEEKRNKNSKLIIYINNEKSGEYKLVASSELQLDILLFKNCKFSARRTADDYFLYKSGYSREEAIQNQNPYKEDGVLLINYHIKQAEFYSTDWNTFCLLIDGRTFTKQGEPISDINIQAEEPLLEKINDYESTENNRNGLELNELFVGNTNEIEELLNDDINEVREVETNIRFREGGTSQTVINSYERNPQARKKCLEYYGTSCFICEFDFGKTFGKIGEGFIHVHHLKPISEIREEYEINPVEDMRPVCPNCHAIIHRRDPVFSIEEMKALLQSPK